MKQVTQSCQQSVISDCLEQKKALPLSFHLQLIPQATFKGKASRSSWEHSETEFARLSSLNSCQHIHVQKLPSRDAECHRLSRARRNAVLSHRQSTCPACSASYAQVMS